MGFSTVIVMACLFTVFLFASSIYVNYTIEGMKVTRSIAEVSDLAYDRIRTILNITDFDTETGEICYFNVTNLGSTSIAIKDFPKMDIILTYLSNQTGEYITVWLEYSDQSDPPNSWSLNTVYNDFVDPISPIQRIGFWNPGEVIEIAATLPPDNTITLQRRVTVVLCMPNGALDQKTFNT